MSPKYDGDFQKHPLYKNLVRFSYQVTPGTRPNPFDQTNETEAETSITHKALMRSEDFEKITRDIAQMSEEWRVMLSADEAMTAYLREVSGKANAEFYTKIVSFVILYRECLNHYGW